MTTLLSAGVDELDAYRSLLWVAHRPPELALFREVCLLDAGP